MVDVRPLYDPVLVRHARAPRLRAPPPAGATTFDGLNRTCGDRVHLHLAGDPLVARFEGEGCALSLGAASALCEAIDSQSPAAALAIVQAYRDALNTPAAAPAPPGLAGDLAYFLAVRAFPARLPCVSLAADTLAAALAAAAPSASPPHPERGPA
ncbi:MAG: iron-sulfur cluster assembly scaffold protein [Deltaproteobacteria bacterium]|jgi:nitrogen fixation NifU-like protein|nr:iron-sulfur cluster assembly scaffold protein [Deltaproteobacteria bacterium]